MITLREDRGILSDADLASALADRLAALSIDASDANLRDLDLPDLDGLAGIIWTDNTAWPDSYREAISARSRPLRSGVWQVRHPSEGIPNRRGLGGGYLG